jgi:septum formation protein
MATPRLILASGSASRRALLAAAGVVFDIQPAAVDEAAIKRDAWRQGLSAEAAALRLADHKATAVSRREPDAIVIGADQILVCDGTWYDKPADAVVARGQLLALRGRSHVLATAVVCHEGGRQVWHDVAAPRLAMRDFGDAFLDCYLAAEAGTLTSTVGCYRLEGRGAQLFDSIDGDYHAILGLPLLPLLSFLRGRRIIPA